MSWARKPAFLIAVAAGLAVLTSLVLTHRWSRLDYYTPDPTIEFRTAFRTMAEHDELMRDREWPYVVNLNTANGGLLYYGSRHTDDPDDPQIGEIGKLWARFGPTVAVTENRLGFFVGSARMGVSAFGEFAMAFALARRDEIPVHTLEPSWDSEVAEMKAEFPVEEVTLFYTLRVFLGERGNETDRAKIERLADRLLRKRGSRPGLAGSLPDLRALDRLWDERFSNIGPWRKLVPAEIHPARQPTRLQRLAVVANEIRDRHAARVILDLLMRGERVFAIAGGSHVVKQEPVLRSGAAALP